MGDTPQRLIRSGTTNKDLLTERNYARSEASESSRCLDYKDGSLYL